MTVHLFQIRTLEVCTFCLLPQLSVADLRPSTMRYERSCYVMLFVNDFCSVNPNKKYQYVQDLKKGLTVPSIMYTPLATNPNLLMNALLRACEWYVGRLCLIWFITRMFSTVAASSDTP